MRGYVSLGRGLESLGPNLLDQGARLGGEAAGSLEQRLQVSHVDRRLLELASFLAGESIRRIAQVGATVALPSLAVKQNKLQ